MRLLVADDSPVMRRLLQVILSGWGYDVVLAQDGAQAWESLRQDDPPRIAILDWVMPEFTGPELCRMVRSRKSGPYVYLLLLTGKNQREDIVEGMGAGADDYVVKPFDKHELEVRIRAGRRIVDLQAELIRVQEQLREQATRDALTGCWNRSTILEILDREIGRSQRERHPLGVAMIDLDHFKEINDSAGHGGGDLVLQQVVHTIRSCIRAYDAIGRYGGEEFLLLLPGCHGIHLLHHAERLRRAITDLAVPWSGRSLQTTASFGLAQTSPTSQLTADELIASADAALYEAKRRGRNRVVYLGPELLQSGETAGGEVTAAMRLSESA